MQAFAERISIFTQWYMENTANKKRQFHRNSNGQDVSKGRSNTRVADIVSNGVGGKEPPQRFSF